MSVELWTIIIVGLSFLLYIYIGWRSRVHDSSGFFVAGQGVPALANGAATTADWMSAACFISMAGLISFLGYDNSIDELFDMSPSTGSVVDDLIDVLYRQRDELCCKNL